MRRVWAWMALNFGKHAGIVGVVGLAITLVLGVGITKLDFATGPGLVPQQGRAGLQGQRRLPGPLRRPGHGHACSRWTRARRSPTCSRPRTSPTSSRSRRSCGPPRACSASSARSPRSSSPRTWCPARPGDVTESVAGQALLGARDREPDPAAQAHPPRRTRSTTLNRINAVPGRAHVRQPRVDRVPAVRQPGRDPQVAAAVLPRREPRADDHPARRATRRSRTRARPPSGSRPSSRPSRSTTPRPRPPARRCCSRTSTTTCAAAC